MNLDFFTNLSNDVNEHSFVLKFIDELNGYLSTIKEGFIENQINKDLTNFLNTTELVSKYKISYTFLESFYEKCSKALKEYSNSFDNGQDFYYVSWNNDVYNKYNINNIYTIDKYSRANDVVSFSISGKDLPKNIQQGMILKKNGNKYEIDINSTNYISKSFRNIAREISNIQDESLKKYRKENNLYVVVQTCPNSMYLQDVETNVVFEEISFPDDGSMLLCNDSVVRFKDGKYIYEKEITNGWFNSFISASEHNEAFNKLMNEPNFSKIDLKNTTFNMISRKNDYSILGYGKSDKYTLKVPNKLIDYWANDNSILYYDSQDKFFYRKF